MTAPGRHQTPPASSGDGTRAAKKSRRNIPPADSYPPLCSPPQLRSPASVLQPRSLTPPASSHQSPSHKLFPLPPRVPPPQTCTRHLLPQYPPPPSPLTLSFEGPSIPSTPPPA